LRNFQESTMHTPTTLRRGAASLALALFATAAAAGTGISVADYQQHRAQLERPAPAAATADAAAIRRGRYVAMTSGCNDCHTPGYPESGGKVAEADWLTGSSVGFRGPWGTSYPANLRLSAQRMSEAQWMARARSPMLPPMPWFSLRDMKDEDVRALYVYLRALGPSGEAAPAPIQPGAPVATPYIEFVPQNLPPQARNH